MILRCFRLYIFKISHWLNFKYDYVLCRKNDTIIHEKDWFMRFDAPLKIILTARFFAAFLVHISDCDETFNYWEPVNPIELFL
jgi:hypothetical protein